ncbi:MAG: Hsp20/alpha crystallin family protein [Actinomycetes bacterium]
MELYRWDPFTALERLDRQFDDIVRKTWGRSGAAPAAAATGAGFVPAVEMAQDGSDVLIKLELPGIDPATDVDVSVHEGRLIVSGERRDVRTEEGRTTLVRELRYGSFRREFALPEGVTPDDIDAGYDKGLLELRLKNVIKPAEQPRKISVAVRGNDTPKQVEGEVETPAHNAS